MYQKLIKTLQTLSAAIRLLEHDKTKAWIVDKLIRQAAHLTQRTTDSNAQHSAAKASYTKLNTRQQCDNFYRDYK